MTLRFEIDKPLGDSEVTLVGEFGDEEEVYLEDVLIGDSSVYELLASAVGFGRSKEEAQEVWAKFEQNLCDMALDEYGNVRRGHIEDIAEYNRDIRDDR